MPDYGRNRIISSAADETLSGTDNADTFVFSPGDGNDTITDFTNGQDLIDLSTFSAISGYDDLTITSNNDDVTIDLTAHGGGTIVLQGFDVDDLDKSDFLFRVNEIRSGAWSGDDTLQGEDGADLFVFEPGHGNDTITGFTDGEDRIDLSAFSTISDFSDLAITSDGGGVTIDLTGHGGGTIRLEGFDVANLGDADFAFRVNHAIEGDEGGITGTIFDNDYLYGYTGNDTIYGGAGDDRIGGGGGDDTLYGGVGDDTFVFRPGNGNDTIKDFTDGEDHIDLSEFSTISDFSDLTITSDDDGVTIDLTGHGGGTIRLEGVDAANLGDADFAFRVNQTIEGGEGDDTIYGGEGDDTIYGGGGDDKLYGGEGDDTLYGGEGFNLLYGREGDDTLTGGTGVDWIFGGTGDDVLHGGEGDDTLIGDWGNKSVGGDDTLYGGAGDDKLEGGEGDDTLTGGEGDDTFVFVPDHGADTIKDFTDGEDIIDLKSITDITAFTDLTITADGTAAVIDLSAHGGGTIRLENVDVTDLDAEDFTFYEAPVDDGGTDGI